MQGPGHVCGDKIGGSATTLYSWERITSRNLPLIYKAKIPRVTATSLRFKTGLNSNRTANEGDRSRRTVMMPPLKTKGKDKKGFDV